MSQSRPKPTPRTTHRLLATLGGALMLASATAFSFPAAAQTVSPDFEATNVSPPKPKPAPAPAPAPTVHPATTPAAPPPKPTTPPPPPPPPPAPINVDIELVMLMDVSGSVDEQEFALQRLGYVNAFRDPELHALVESRNGIAVNLVQWSGPRQQAGTSWMVLRTAKDCTEFAERVSRFDRRFEGDTVLAAALSTARWILQHNSDNGAKIVGARQIIDVSGDGICENQYFYATGKGGAYSDGTPMGSDYYGWDWNGVQQTLASEGFIVNGISIGDKPGLKEWYASDVARGEFSFAMHADTFEAFNDAIKKKLMRELATPTTEIGTAYD